MKDDLIGYLASFSQPITGLKIGTDTQIRRYTAAGHCGYL